MKSLFKNSFALTATSVKANLAKTTGKIREFARPEHTVMLERSHTLPTSCPWDRLPHLSARLLNFSFSQENEGSIQHQEHSLKTLNLLSAQQITVP